MLAFPHVAQKVRHEAVLNSIETERESIVLRGRRSDGVGASELFTIGLGLFQRQPLAGYKAEARNSLHFEFEMLSRLR